MPTNAFDNANPRRKVEMAEISLKWGRLAPFPKTAKDFQIHTEGSMFTRTFVGSFSDSPEAVSAWLRASIGVTEGEERVTEDGSVLYILKTEPDVNSGEVMVSPDGTRVSFQVVWS